MRANASRRPLDSALHDFPGRHRINASIIRDKITGLAAIAIAAAALVAGCGGQASVPLPAHSTSVHAPTASPSPADTGSARAQVIAAYTAYFPASKAAEAAAPSRAQAILAPYAAQPYLRNVLAQMAWLPRPRRDRLGLRGSRTSPGSRSTAGRRGVRLPGRQPRRPGQHQHREGDPRHCRESPDLPDRQPRPRLRRPVADHLPRPRGRAMLARVLALAVTAAAVTAAALAGAGTAPAPRPAAGSCGASGYPWGYDISCQSGTATPGASGAGARPVRAPPGPSARRARCTRSRETRTTCCRCARTGC